MKTNNFKYVLSIATDIFPNLESYDNFDYQPLRSTSETVEFSEDNLLESRKRALERVKSHTIVFEAQPHNIPTWKWNTRGETTKKYWMLYQIQVFLIGENEGEVLCVYDDGDGLEFNEIETNSKVFDDLLKEYEIFKKLGIDTNQYEESIKFKDWGKILNWDKEPDWEKIEKTEANILPNGMDWSDAQINLEANRISDEQWNLINNVLNGNESSIIKKESTKKNLQNKTNIKTEYKTTAIHRININLDKIEISVKTTSEIPKEIQNELIALIDKWKNL